jgi:cytochrome c-type biogenesis protein
MNPDQIILSGSLLLAIPLAALAGLVSFLSPCVLPLVPGYLGFVSGMVGKSPSANVEKDSISRQRILLGTLLFVLGFSAVFVSYGSLFGALGSLIYGRNGQILQQVL